MKIVLRILILVGVAYLHGCATVPMASVENDTARKSFPAPTSGTAGLYIYRNTHLGGALKKNLYIDGVRVAQSAAMTYFYFEVEDGIRKLSTQSEFSPNDIVVEVEQGKNYFVEQSIRPGLFVGGAKLTLVTEERGKAGVLLCKLANNLNGNVLVHSGKLNTPTPVTPADTENGLTVYDFYGQAEEEINTNNHDQKLWEQSLVETGGDPQKTKVRYIKLRANQLYADEVGFLSPAKTGSFMDISGTYNSVVTGNYRESGVVEIEQTGNQVTGRFTNKEWEIEGELDGNIVDFTWYNPSNKGKGKFTIDSSGRWIGEYRGDSWGKGNWTLSRVSGSKPIQNQQAVLQAAQPLANCDISGTYISEITVGGSAPSTKKFMKDKNQKQFILQNSGGKITGFDSALTLSISGTCEEGVVNFYIVRGNQINGFWKIDTDTTRLEGEWSTDGHGGASGKWNLTKVQ